MSLVPPSFKLGRTLGDPGAKLGGNGSGFFQLDGGLSVSGSRTTNAHQGAGHIAGLVLQGRSVLYRTTMRMTAHVISPTSTKDTPPASDRDITVYVRVPEYQRARFEALLKDRALDTPTYEEPARDVDTGDSAPATQKTAETSAAELLARDAIRHRPLSMAAGLGPGFSAIDHLAGGQKVLPTLVDLVERAGEKMAVSREWTEMERAYFRLQ